MPYGIQPQKPDWILALCVIFMCVIVLFITLAFCKAALGAELQYIPPHIQILNNVIESANLVLIPRAAVNLNRSGTAMLNSILPYLNKGGNDLVKWGKINGQLPPLSEEFVFGDIDFEKVK